MIAVSLLDYRQLRTVRAGALRRVPAWGCSRCSARWAATVNGAKSWIALPGGFQIEPSEFAKIGDHPDLAMMLGRSARRGNRARGARDGGAGARACGGCRSRWWSLEPDLGVAIVLLVVLVGLIALSGIRLRWLAGLAVARRAGRCWPSKLHLLKAYQLRPAHLVPQPVRRPAGHRLQRRPGARSRSAPAGCSARGCSTAR